MNKSKITVITVFALLIVALAVPFAASAQEEAITASNPLSQFSDLAEVEGSWATLTRAENGLTMALHTSGLSAEEVYTVWWVVFNAPENCSNGECGEDDIFVFEVDELVLDEDNNPVFNIDGLEAAQISIQYAAGGYIDEDGEGHFGGSVGTDNVPGIVVGPGVLNPTTAEVHLVVRTHGPVVEDLFDAQITTFGGACGPVDGGAPCADHQFVVFLPPMS